MSEFNWVKPSKKEPPDPKYLEAVRYGAKTKNNKRLRDAEAEMMDVFGTANQAAAPKTPSGRAKKKRAVTEEITSEEELDLDMENKGRSQRQGKKKEVTLALETVVTLLPHFSTTQPGQNTPHNCNGRETDADSNGDWDIKGIAKALGSLTEEVKTLRAKI
ncbi:hypothetical protein H2248_003406 [Termitomyces sp. 'cryptogamus']|nr:hypothetical protein H2248_003406 [Termitomyces sp. 'cryptogamus']